MSSNIDLIPDSVRKSLSRISSELAKYDIKMMAVGGIAVLFHGRARLSRDLDIAVAIDAKEKAEGLLSVIKRTDEYRMVYPDSLTKLDEPRLDSTSDLEKINLVKIRDKATNVMIDILLVWAKKPLIYGLDTNSFTRAVKVEGTLKGKREIFVIPSPEDFILMKLVARRPATADFEDLFTAIVKNSDRLDWEYLSKRAKELNIWGLFESYRKLAEEKARDAES